MYCWNRRHILPNFVDSWNIFPHIIGYRNHLLLRILIPTKIEHHYFSGKLLLLFYFFWVATYTYIYIFIYIYTYIHIYIYVYTHIYIYKYTYNIYINTYIYRYIYIYYIPLYPWVCLRCLKNLFPFPGSHSISRGSRPRRSAKTARNAARMVTCWCSQQEIGFEEKTMGFTSISIAV